MSILCQGHNRQKQVPHRYRQRARGKGRDETQGIGLNWLTVNIAACLRQAYAVRQNGYQVKPMVAGTTSVISRLRREARGEGKEGKSLCSELIAGK
jgi:hypothetical protein